MNDPKPCPTCGTCPTCGRPAPYQFRPTWYPYQPYWYWTRSVPSDTPYNPATTEITWTGGNSQ